MDEECKVKTKQHKKFVVTRGIRLPERVYSQPVQHHQAYDVENNTTSWLITPTKLARGIRVLRHAMFDQVGLVQRAQLSRPVHALSRPW